MNYETIVDKDGREHIVLDLGNGAFKSIPAVESNPEYAAFLESLNDNTIEAE